MFCKKIGTYVGYLNYYQMNFNQSYENKYNTIRA